MAEVGLAVGISPEDPTSTAMTIWAPSPERADREVLDVAAVDQEPPIELHRREDDRDRHARADRPGEVAPGDLDGLAGLDVGRDRVERDRKLLEVVDPRGGQGRGREEEARAFCRRPEPGGIVNPPSSRPPAPGHRGSRLPCGGTSASWPRRVVVEDVDPVGRADDLLQLRGAVAGRVEAADDRAHGRARDAVDRDPKLLEHLEDADVRSAARAAASEGEADAAGLRAAQRTPGRKPAPVRARAPPATPLDEE